MGVSVFSRRLLRRLRTPALDSTAGAGDPQRLDPGDRFRDCAILLHRTNRRDRGASHRDALLQHRLRVDAVGRRHVHVAVHDRGVDIHHRARAQRCALVQPGRPAGGNRGPVPPQSHPHAGDARRVCRARAAHVPPLRSDRGDARLRNCGVVALDGAESPAHRHRDADEHARRRTVVVRHSAGRTLSAQPGLQSAIGLRIANLRLHQPRAHAHPGARHDRMRTGARQHRLSRLLVRRRHNQPYRHCRPPGWPQVHL